MVENKIDIRPVVEALEAVVGQLDELAAKAEAEEQRAVEAYTKFFEGLSALLRERCRPDGYRISVR